MLYLKSIKECLAVIIELFFNLGILSLVMIGCFYWIEYILVYLYSLLLEKPTGFQIALLMIGSVIIALTSIIACIKGVFYHKEIPALLFKSWQDMLNWFAMVSKKGERS